MPAETKGIEHHTGWNPSEGRALKQLQTRFLEPFWAPGLAANGYYDVPTKMAVIKAQHNARFEMTGLLDEKTWIHIQLARP